MHFNCEHRFSFLIFRTGLTATGIAEVYRNSASGPLHVYRSCFTTFVVSGYCTLLSCLSVYFLLFCPGHFCVLVRAMPKPAPHIIVMNCEEFFCTFCILCDAVHSYLVILASKLWESVLFRCVKEVLLLNGH
jgi:hypothetical protein